MSRHPGGSSSVPVTLDELFATFAAAVAAARSALEPGVTLLPPVRLPPKMLVDVVPVALLLPVGNRRREIMLIQNALAHGSSAAAQRARKAEGKEEKRRRVRCRRRHEPSAASRVERGAGGERSGKKGGGVARSLLVRCSECVNAGRFCSCFQ